MLFTQPQKAGISTVYNLQSKVIESGRFYKLYVVWLSKRSSVGIDLDNYVYI